MQRNSSCKVPEEKSCMMYLRNWGFQSGDIDFGYVHFEKPVGQSESGRQWDFPRGAVVKNLPVKAGDMGSSPGP